MKDFFKYVGATIVGLIFFGLIIGIIGILSVVGMISSSQSTQNVSKNTVMVLNLSDSLKEQGEDNILSQFAGETFKGLGGIVYK